MYVYTYTHRHMNASLPFIAFGCTHVSLEHEVSVDMMVAHMPMALMRGSKKSGIEVQDFLQLSA